VRRYDRRSHRSFRSPAQAEMTPAQIYAIKIKLLSMPRGPKRDALAKLLQNKTKTKH
jgi:hypothetical protein